MGKIRLFLDLFLNNFSSSYGLRFSETLDFGKNRN